jgi:hypothetical protein
MPRDAPRGLLPASLLLAIEDAVRREILRRKFERSRASLVDLEKRSPIRSDEEGAKRLAALFMKDGYL